jgi:ribosomal protein S18 acetylase RimI-like enzyme
MPPFIIRATTPADRPGVIAMLTDAFARPEQVVRGQWYRPQDMPGFIAERHGEAAGLIAYFIHDDVCEIMALVSLEENQGIGSALLKAVQETARSAGCRRLRVVTTNDNMRALRLYQKRGFRLAELRVNATNEARQLKPEIPLLGNDGIPLRDELELEMEL